MQIIRKNKHALFIIACLIIILLDVTNSLKNMKQYPQLSISNKELLGKNGENLEDFQISEDGSLISQSDDPWAYFTLPKTMNINSVCIIVESVETQYTWAQLHFILDDGTWIHQSFHIKNGINIIESFNDSTKLCNVSAIRFDLLSAEDASIKVNRAIVNSRYFMTVKYHLISIILIIISYITLLKYKILKKLTNVFKSAKAHIKTCILAFSLKPKKVRIILNIVITIFIFLISHIQLELSTSGKGLVNIFQMNIKYILINIITAWSLYVLIYFLTNSQWISSILYSIFIFFISVINYYTIKYHGMPLSIMDVKNFRTAINVIDDYSFSIKEISNLLVLFFIELFLCFILKWITVKHIRTTYKDCWIKRSCICLISFVLFYFCYLSPKPAMEADIGWSWKNSYPQYGYMACTVQSAIDLWNFPEEPDGYQEEQLDNIDIPNYINQNKTPDIILILNETFYDLNLITNIKTNSPYLENINNLENAIKGYAVVPSIGGSTNSSEYELLTSNSMQLMQGITPFNIVEMNNANSIVSHLRQLGHL